DLIFDNHFSPDEPGVFEPIRETLLTKGDYYMHLADLKGYVETQQMVSALYRDGAAWAQKAIHNVARSGKFSSDRPIFEYARAVLGALDGSMLTLIMFVLSATLTVVQLATRRSTPTASGCWRRP